MSVSLKLAAAVGLSLVAMSGVASAADYKVTVLQDGGNFLGCLAQNDKTGVGFLAVGASVVVFGNSAKFPFAKGDEVKGSWSVDGGTDIDFAAKTDSAHTVTLEVPNTAEAVTAITTGKTLTIQANEIEAELSLAGSGQAFADLVQCMQTKKAM